MIYTVKGFWVVNEAEVFFWNSLAFFMIQRMLAIFLTYCCFFLCVCVVFFLLVSEILAYITAIRYFFFSNIDIYSCEFSSFTFYLVCDLEQKLNIHLSVILCVCVLRIFWYINVLKMGTEMESVLYMLIFNMIVLWMDLPVS